MKIWSLADIRFLARMKIGKIPVLHRLLEQFRPSLSHRLVIPSTSIVIEGFPRCDNTFAYHAFLHAQGEAWAGHIGHHVHVPSQLMYAEKESIPAVLLIRPPRETVLSLVVRNRRLTVGAALRGYITYYNQPRALAEYCVVAPFEIVTSDFGTIIERVNEKFETDFLVFDHTPETENAVFRRIDRVSGKTDPARHPGIARPTKSKEELKDERRRELDAHPDLLASAQRLHREICTPESS